MLHKKSIDILTSLQEQIIQSHNTISSLELIMYHKLNVINTLNGNSRPKKNKN